jgi:uncharacterized protein (DUF1330 family)
MNFLRRIFGAQIVEEPIQMRVENLSSWLDKKFLPKLEITIDQLKTNTQSCQSYADDVEKAVEEFTTDVLKNAPSQLYQYASKKQVYLASVKALAQTLKEEVDMDEITTINQYYDKIKNILERLEKVQVAIEHIFNRYFPKTHKPLAALVETIYQNYKQSRDILENPEYQSYMSIRSNLKSYLSKQKEKVLLDKKKKEFQLVLDEQKKKAFEYKRKYEQIQNDPKYQLEKTAVQSNKFSHSVYELELMDRKSKFDQQKEKYYENKRRLEKLDLMIENLGLQRELFYISKKIKEQLAIEVEFIEADTDVSKEVQSEFDNIRE